MGVRTGLALYNKTGRLGWVRSHNFGNKNRLKRAAHQLLNELPQLSWLVVEGGGPLAELWLQEARKRKLHTFHLMAEDWRKDLLYPREQRNGIKAKAHAEELARKVIRWSEAPMPKNLMHDAAEAILIGLWAVKKNGWLKEFPAELNRF